MWLQQRGHAQGRLSDRPRYHDSSNLFLLLHGSGLHRTLLVHLQVSFDNLKGIRLAIPSLIERNQAER